MSNDRTVAKRNFKPVPIVEDNGNNGLEGGPNEPRMREAMSSADRLKAELQEQQHLQRMKTKERGWFGIVFGTESLASIVIAAFVILLSFSTAITFEVIGAKTGRPEYWSHEAQPMWAIVTAALGYIFGRGNRSSR